MELESPNHTLEEPKGLRHALVNVKAPSIHFKKWNLGAFKTIPQTFLNSCDSFSAMSLHYVSSALNLLFSGIYKLTFYVLQVMITEDSFEMHMV